MAAPPLAGIFGTGRSGTTWLGSILNAHPEVAYRFEPFHRQRRDAVLDRVHRRLSEGRLEGGEIRELYEKLLRAHPFTDKPPFFPKRNVSGVGRRQAWFAARTCPPLRPVFARMYSPRDQAPVVLKEVTMEPLMRGFLLHTDVPIVYLVRHPCATVASLVRGQQQGRMPVGRIDVLDSLLQKHDAALHERFAADLDGLNRYQQNALLWRIDAERALGAIREAGRGLVMTFEELCDDAHRHIERVCREFDLEFTDEIAAYLDQLYELSGSDQGRRKDVRHQYFTVYRNPRVQRDKWKSALPDRHREEIEAIVGDSVVLQACAGNGEWN